jgi:hypothetical protein
MSSLLCHPSMKGRLVSRGGWVRGLLWLGVGARAAGRRGRRLQSSIRSRCADQGVVRCQGAQSRPAAVLFTGEQETRHRSGLALACTSRPLVERKSGVGWWMSCGVRQLVVDVVGLVGQAADLAVAQAVVAEGEDLAGDGDSRDLAAAAFCDPFVLGSERPAAGGGVLSGLAEPPAQDRGALAGDVSEAGFAVGAGTAASRARRLWRADRSRWSSRRSRGRSR